MNRVADSALFDAANQLFHLPETIEKLVLPAARPYDGAHGSEERGFVGVPVDILETPKGYTFFLDVPGLPKADIQVPSFFLFSIAEQTTIQNRRIYISNLVALVTLEDEKMLVIKSSGKRKREEGEEEGCRYLLLERRGSPRFLRRFRLPDDSNASAIAARCENGVLTVFVEKLPPPPQPKAKTVEVTVA